MMVNKFIKKFESLDKETQEITKNKILEYLSKKDNSELFKKIKIYIDETIKSSIIDIINNEILIKNTHNNIKHSNKKNIIKYITKLLTSLNIDIENVFDILNNNTLYELRQKKIILKIIKTEIKDFKFEFEAKHLDYLSIINFSISFKNIKYYLDYYGALDTNGGEKDKYIFEKNFDDEYKYIIENIFIIDYVFDECCIWCYEFK